jgi:acyl-CoA synthetase (NDP forming)
MDFTRIFKPKSLAVVGVSLTNDRHPANVIYNKNNLRQQVEVFPVNGRGGKLREETVYPRIAEIPKKVDLAVIATRAETVPQVLRDCIAAGVGGAIVISGGFAESGRKDLQDALVAIAHEARFPFIGPNCLGIYAPPTVDTFFIPSERIVRPDPGKVAMVSQSGGILVDYMIKFWEEGVGLSLAVSIGNKALIREIDLLEYFARDPGTDVVAFYVEGFGENEGREFAQAAARCRKPVVVLKSGKSPGGSRAVSSHTASMAGDYEVFSSVLSQFGVIEARNESEMIASCEVLSCFPRAIEGRIGIITGSGGHGAQAVDSCFASGLAVPTLTDAVQQKLKERLAESIRGIASLRNPIDLTGSAVDEDFVEAARSLSRNPEIDCLLLLLLPYLPGITSDLGARLSLLYRQEGKPMIAYVPHVERYRMLIEGFQLNRMPVAHSIEEVVHMAQALKGDRKC